MPPKVCYLAEDGRFRTVSVTLLGDSPHLTELLQRKRDICVGRPGTRVLKYKGEAEAPGP